MPVVPEQSPELRLSCWMRRLGWLGLNVSSPLFVLAAVVSWWSHVLFSHCNSCEALAWSDLYKDAGHIIVVLLILGLGFVRSVMHLKAANRLVTGDPTARRRGALTYAAVGVLHALAVSVSIRHSTAPLVAVLLAWPITLLVLLGRDDLSGEPPLPAVTIARPSRRSS